VRNPQTSLGPQSVFVRLASFLRAGVWVMPDEHKPSGSGLNVLCWVVGRLSGSFQKIAPYEQHRQPGHPASGGIRGFRQSSFREFL